MFRDSMVLFMLAVACMLLFGFGVWVPPEPGLLDLGSKGSKLILIFCRLFKSGSSPIRKFWFRLRWVSVPDLLWSL